MNIIFFTQSKSLDVFYELYLRLKGKTEIAHAGFYVANLLHYEKFLTKHPGFEKKFSVLKEWEIYQRAARHKASLERIKDFENEIGDPTLWGSIVTDRRLYMGKKATFHQDYKPRFSYEGTLAIIDIALQEIEQMFRIVKPDLVFTLYTATFGDCLGHQFAQARGIKSLDLRLARLKNYVMFADGIKDPPPHIAHTFKEFKERVPANLKKEAEDYIRLVIEKNAMYEGVVPSVEKQKNTRKGCGEQKSFLSPHILLKVIGCYKKFYKLKKAPYCFDYQNPDFISSFLYKKFFNSFTFKKIKLELRDSMVCKNDLKDINYILYPLHTEPELVLSQFARPYLNQIEVIRNISLSMPIWMTLLVKEHPMMAGRRSLGYYKKLLEIPNVKLVMFDLSSEVVLKHARLVVIIRGAIGLEAVINKKPVVSLGKSLFDMLPSTMFRSCWNLFELPHAIRDMLDNYRYDHDSLVQYLAAVMKGSAPVNLVTDLLGKTGRYRAGIERKEQLFEEHPHLDILANYLLERINN